MKLSFCRYLSVSAGIILMLATVPVFCQEKETVSGNLFSVTLDSSCRLSLSYPSTAAGAYETLESVSLSAGGYPVQCQRFRKDNNWLYFSATTDTGDYFKGLLAIEKTGVVRFELEVQEGAPVEWDMAFTTQEGEHFYGFGEKASWFDYRGRISTVKSHDANVGTEGFRGDNSYKSVPFFSSSRGYGVWLDDYVEAVFDMDSSRDGRWSVESTDDYLRLYFFAGPLIRDVIVRYTSLAGRPPLWPRWVFAPWKGRDVHYSAAEVEEDIIRRRDLDIPGSIIIIDSPWETAYNNFRFNRLQFGNVKKLFTKAHDNGYKVLLWITPFSNIRNESDMMGIFPGKTGNYEKIKANSGFINDDNGQPVVVEWWKGEGSLLDFTNPWTVEYFKRAVKHLAESGADGFKADDGEGFYVRGSHFYDQSIPARRMKNYYSHIYLKTAYEAWKEATGEPVIWARSGSAGTQKYSIQWPGDNKSDWGRNGLPSAVICGQSAAMSGYSIWGNDIAGYIGKPDPELFIRWTQFGALTPVMETFMGSNQSVWDFGDRALETARRYAKLHTSLFPYIYAYARDARDTGLPIIRPLPLIYQDDPQAHIQRHQYLFGDYILSAPVIEKGARAREVYFPPGSKWYEFWGDRFYTGGTIEEVDAPLEELPFFVREGAIIPMLPDDVDTLVPAEQVKVPEILPMDDRLIIRVWPSEKVSRFRLEDGTLIVSTLAANTVKIEVLTEPRRIWVNVNGFQPSSIETGEEAIEKMPLEDVMAGNKGWSYNMVLHDTWIFMDVSEQKPFTITLKNQEAD